jgi:hypothetical protein
VPPRTMSAQPRLELVTSEDVLAEEVISPELVLVDPELAARARARLELPRSAPYVVPQPVVPRTVPLPEPVPLLADVVPVVPDAPKPAPVVVALQPLQPVPTPAAEDPLVVSHAPVVEQPPPPVVRAASPRRPSRVSKLRLLTVGIAIGLVGGIIAADVWMPPSASVTTVPRTVPPVGGTKVEPKAETAEETSKAKPATTAPTVAAPAFVWVAVPGATRYEVVFERAGKTVYRATTTLTRLELPPSWRFEGATHRLVPGRYRWTVWPLKKGKRGPAVVSSDYTA